MPIIIQCNSCGTSLKAPDKAQGKSLPCPKCKQAIHVPVPDITADLEPLETTKSEVDSLMSPGAPAANRPPAAPPVSASAPVSPPPAPAPPRQPQAGVTPGMPPQQSPAGNQHGNLPMGIPVGQAAQPAMPHDGGAEDILAPEAALGVSMGMPAARKNRSLLYQQISVAALAVIAAAVITLFALSYTGESSASDEVGAFKFSGQTVDRRNTAVSYKNGEPHLPLRAWKMRNGDTFLAMLYRLPVGQDLFLQSEFGGVTQYNLHDFDDVDQDYILRVGMSLAAHRRREQERENALAARDNSNSSNGSAAGTGQGGNLFGGSLQGSQTQNSQAQGGNTQGGSGQGATGLDNAMADNSGGSAANSNTADNQTGQGDQSGSGGLADTFADGGAAAGSGLGGFSIGDAVEVVLFDGSVVKGVVDRFAGPRIYVRYYDVTFGREVTRSFEPHEVQMAQAQPVPVKPEPEFKTWTVADGEDPVEATFISANKDLVTVQTEDEEFVVLKFDELTEEEKEYAAEQRELRQLVLEEEAARRAAGGFRVGDVVEVQPYFNNPAIEQGIVQKVSSLHVTVLYMDRRRQRQDSKLFSKDEVRMVPVELKRKRWVGLDGRDFVAQFVSANDEYVTVEKASGETFVLKIATLPELDKYYVQRIQLVLAQRP